MNAPDDKQFKSWLSRKMKTARQDELARVPYEQREGSGGGGLSDLMKLSREAYGWSPAADVEDIHRAYKDPSLGNLTWAALAATGPVGKVFKKGAKAAKSLRKAYHATTAAPFDKFITYRNFGRRGKIYPGDIGAWFSDTEDATREIAQTFKDYRGRKGDIRTISVDLDLKNPKVYPYHDDFSNDLNQNQTANAFRNRLKKDGHDGIVITNSDTDFAGPRTDFAVFEPEQIFINK